MDITPANGKLSKDLLKSEQIYLLQAASKLMIWVGSKAPLANKRESMTDAVAFIKAVS